MKQDINKFLSKSLHVYYFLLLVVVIIKLIGFDYFSLDTNNNVLLKINNFFVDYHLTDVYYSLTLLLYAYIIISVSCDNNTTQIKKYVLYISPLLILITIFTTWLNNTLISTIIDMIHLCLFSIIFSKYNNISVKKTIKNYIKVFLITIVFQLISVFIRVSSLDSYDYGFIVNVILDIDYILLSLIYYELHFKGGVEQCLDMEVGSSSPIQNLSTNSLKKFQIKSLSNKDKFELFLSFIINLFWNCFTVGVVLIIAFLNNTIIECLFILISFWSSKFSFGKPFHFKSVITCFIVSNLTYYALNRITLPIGISLFIPILLGVGLSFITAIRTKGYKEMKLYKGICEEDFYKIIKQVTDNELEIKICKEFYCDRLPDFKIAIRNNYSVATIRLKRQTINKKLKELNK